MTITRPRRSRFELESRVVEAAEGSQRAQAHYDLAVFHDNNSREADAIPHYEAALAAGLAPEVKARCLAWLASSLYKTGRPREAIQRLRQLREIAHEEKLVAFLQGLERRIQRRSSPR